MFYSDDNEDSDDEWFYNSFKRYDDLLMYDVHGTITSTAFRSDDKLFMAASGGLRHEVWELSIPKKIITDKDRLSRDRDFSLLTAGYTASLVKRMFPVESRLITSESSGIYLYSVPDSSDETDMITLKIPILKDDSQAPITVLDSKIYCARNASSILSFDINSEKFNPISLNLANKEVLKGKSSSLVSELCCSSGNIYMCFMDTGEILVLDPRQHSSLFKCINCEPSGEKWTMAVSENNHFIATLGSGGTLKVYDNRNQSNVIFNHTIQVQEELKVPKGNHICVQLCPTNSFVSVSGLSKNVEILDFKKNGTEANIFSHDGHRGKEVQNIVTHSWHPFQQKLLFSADDTGQLQAWRFKVS